MIEKVNPCHPDKVADRIAGAIVDLAYKKEINPKIAVEVLIGHGVCHIIAETSVKLNKKDVKAVVKRIAGNVKVDFVQVAQDVHTYGKSRMLGSQGSYIASLAVNFFTRSLAHRWKVTVDGKAHSGSSIAALILLI